MKVTNIKLSFLFEKNLFRNINSKVIWKNDNIFYTVYQHRKNLLNITGIKTKSEIDEQKVAMQKLLHQKVLKVRIDNIFFSQKNFDNLDMSLFYNYMKNNSFFFVDYNIELFAGMYLHPKLSCYPTIVIFRTGSYQIMGGKSFKLSYKTEIFLKKLINMFRKNTK